MSKEFVRTIKNTRIKGDIVEPFYTNVQNDILNDDENIYIRKEKSEKVPDKYHCLTDNIKTITVPKNNDVIEVKKTSKNVRQLIAKETVINSLDDRLLINKNSTNNYDLDLDLSEIENEVSNLKERSAALENDVNDLQDKVTALESNINELENNNMTLQNKYDDLENKYDDLEIKVNDLLDDDPA